ncbi:phosphopantetheine-binding protein [Streptomyces albus]|uniref:phosphopantetheine-binding protein n=1 Tax=Streptomyces albus TaxID=1888 RepID=UPI000A4D7D98|nr:phosphopantetheine-binding protein [Streptomyces albus]
MTTGISRTGTISERVTALLQEKLGLLPEEITPEARFKEDLGLDSLDMVELLTIVEVETGAPVEDDTALSMATIGDVIGHLSERGTGEGE